MKQELQLLIVAGDPLVRAALASLFDNYPDCQVVGQTSPVTLISDPAILEESEINLVIWDFGWESADMATVDFQELDKPVLVLITDPLQAQDAWSAGASAIISRDASAGSLAASALAAAQGLLVVDPDLAAFFLPSPPNQAEKLTEMPTPREIEVLHLMAEGLTNKSIAQQLEISPHTVKYHVNAILGKMNAQSRTEAVVRATRLGLIAL